MINYYLYATYYIMYVCMYLYMILRCLEIFFCSVYMCSHMFVCTSSKSIFLSIFYSSSFMIRLWKVNMDIYYFDNKILWLTIMITFFGMSQTNFENWRMSYTQKSAKKLPVPILFTKINDKKRSPTVIKFKNGFKKYMIMKGE